MATTTAEGIGSLSLNVTGATGNGVSPIVLTCSSMPTSVQVGQRILVASVGGNTNANGIKTVTAVNHGALTVTFAGTGNGAYTSGGTVKREYATIDLWIAGTALNLVGLDQVRVGELYADADFKYPFGSTINITGATTDATRYRMLRAWRNATTGYSHRFDPIFREGVLVNATATTTRTDAIKVSESYFRLEGVGVYLVDNSTPISSGGPYRGINVATASARIDGCFVLCEEIDSTAVTVECISHSSGVTSSTLYLQVTNSIALGSGVAGDGAISGFRSALDYDRFYNCVAYRCAGGSVGRGFHTNGTNALVRNCISIESTFADFNVSGTATFSHCISSDATASGTSSETSVIASGLFRNAPFWDFRALQGSVAVDVGVDLSSVFTADIAATTRTAPWEIGCYNGFADPDTDAPTIVEETIGTGGDYASVTDWTLATDLHLVARNEIRRGLLLDATGYDTAVALQLAITDARRYRELTHAAGNRYDPITETGAYIFRDTVGSVVRLMEDFSRIEGVRVDNLYSTSSASDCACVALEGDGTRATAVFAEIHDTAGAGASRAFWGTGANVRIRNCIAVGGDNTTGATAGFDVTGAGSRVQNCDATRIRRGTSATCFVDGGAGGVWFENCVAGSTDVGFDVTEGFQRNNASTDATAAGVSSITGIATGQVFVDSPNNDFRLIAGCALVNAGANLSLEFSTDFAGADRSGSWEVGAYTDFLAPAEWPCIKPAATHRQCPLWKIERRDGVTITLSGHTSELVFQGLTYSPAGGFTASTHRREASLRDHSLDATGPLSDSVVTFSALDAEAFRNARVTLYIVDWLYPWLAPIRTSVFVIRSPRFDGEQWQARLEGLASLLKRTVGRTHGKLCPYALGDPSPDPNGRAGCGIDISLYTQFDIEIDSVSDARTLNAKSSGGGALSGTFADDYFAFGWLTWKTGNNAGLRSEIQGYVQATRQITLWVEAPYDIQAGDTFDIVAGDDKSFDTCRTRFNNGENFGGDPYIPGTLKAIQTPTQ